VSFVSYAPWFIGYVVGGCGIATRNQWCQNNASNRMIGIGTPNSQSKTPRPKPMVDILVIEPFPTQFFVGNLTQSACFGFHLWNWCFHRWTSSYGFKWGDAEVGTSDQTAKSDRPGQGHICMP
jgi:hypothetical protein